MMKRITKCALALAMAVAAGTGLTAQAGDRLTGKALMERLKSTPKAFAAPKGARVTMPVFGNANFRDSRFPLQPNKAEATAPTAVMGPTSVWGVIQGPGETDWMYQQTNTKRGQYDIGSAQITVYNEKGEEVGTVTVDIPEDQYVNDVQVFGNVTTNFFDRDNSSYEMTVYVNNVVDYTPTGRIEAYSLGNGRKVASYPGRSALYFSETENYSTFQRYAVVEDMSVDGVYYEQVSVYSPATYSSQAPVLEHTFMIPYDNLQYSDGPFFNFYYIDSEPYYVVSHYEKPYTSGYDEVTWEPIVTEDNRYLVTVYGADFEQVKQLSIPVETQPGAYYTFYTFGYFSYDDLCRGLYSGDDKLNFIITRYDYMLSGDNYLYDIIVYNEDGEQVKTIGERLVTWQQLSPVKGQPEQYMMGHSGESESMDMVDLPSCEVVATFPGVLDGDLLSTNLDRYAKGDSYQYAIALGNGYEDDNGNTITKIGWYNKDLSLDRFVEINLGAQGIYAQHYFVTGSLNPYLFNTDDMHEYILIATLQDSGTLVSDNVLCIANDNGEIKYEFKGDEAKGDFNYGFLSGVATGTPRLIVSYMNDNYEYTLETYNLPFTKFAGGTGTQDDPYIIATPGDLDQIRNEPAAFYALGADLDMSGIYGKFKPISGFAGGLDGRGHSIDNLDIDGGYMYVGMFGDVADCQEIKDITLNRPVIECGQKTNYAGILAGSLAGTEAVVKGVSVNNALITADETVDAYIGGIAGEMTYYAKITEAAVNNLTVDAAGSKRVGGIAGLAMTSASVNAAAASGSITACEYVGGIIGYSGNGVTISNCHADVALTGENGVGGIAGCSNRGLIDRCYSQGSITATKANRWTGFYSVGGIVGNLATDWAGSDDIVVSNCLAAIDAIILPEGAETNTAHRIIGRSINDEVWADNETPRTEVGLSNNYAVATMTVNGADLSNEDATTVEGADVAADALGDSFFAETLGFAYGTTAEQPWKQTAAMPILYFEERATGVTLDRQAAEMSVFDEITLTATVEGASAGKVVFTSSDENVAEVMSVLVEGNTATAVVRCNAEGTAAITAAIDGQTATCTVTGVASGIGNVAIAGRLAIRCGEGLITADSATRIEVYSPIGVKVATANAGNVEVGGLASGVYVVVAKDATGNTKTAKVMVK